MEDRSSVVRWYVKEALKNSDGTSQNLDDVTFDARRLHDRHASVIDGLRPTKDEVRACLYSMRRKGEAKCNRVLEYVGGSGDPKPRYATMYLWSLVA